MNKSEIAEIKKQFFKDSNIINKISACYVDANKEIKLISRSAFYALSEDETFKYEEIFKKTLSGKLGKNLLNLDFKLHEEEEGANQEFLLRLRNSKLEDEELLKEFYAKVIESYAYAENYYIILIDINYDIPLKGKDGFSIDDASEEVYHALLCSICPVKLEKAGLIYDTNKGIIENRVRDWLVEAPMNGFLFPAFNDRSTDIHSVLFFNKKVQEMDENFISSILTEEIPISSKEQKELVESALKKSLGENMDYETVTKVYEKITDMIALNEENEEPLKLNKKSILDIIEDAGAEAESLEIYDRVMDDGIEVLAENIIDTKKFEIKRPGVSIKADPESMHLIKTELINGRKCLVIVADESVEVNGLRVKTI